MYEDDCVNIQTDAVLKYLLTGIPFHEPHMYASDCVSIKYNCPDGKVV